MNACPRPANAADEAPRLAPMRMDEVDEVLGIEVRVYGFPWSRGNFVDSLLAGHWAEVLRDHGGELLGYWIAMPAADEMHLLNLAVAPAHQRRGHARAMLDALVRRSRAAGARTLWLEVRDSNERAQSLYRRYGFVAVGRRRGYYPAPHGQREDAVLMRLALDGAHDALD